MLRTSAEVVLKVRFEPEMETYLAEAELRRTSYRHARALVDQGGQQNNTVGHENRTKSQFPQNWLHGYKYSELSETKL